MVVWITGLPGSGKTTISQLLFEQLKGKGKQVVLLDGDSLRKALNNYSYDKNSRISLAKTYSQLSKMMSSQGQIAICATVSMFDEIRDWNKANIPEYYEVYLRVSQEELKKRNQKQLYSMAEQGIQTNVHGFDLAIEEPKQPNLIIDNNGQHTPNDLVNRILQGLNYDYE